MYTKIFVTRHIPENGITLLKKIPNVHLDIFQHDKKISRSELKKRVYGTHIIISLLTENIDKEIMDSAGSQLKMIANYAVGFDNIDLLEAKKRNIVVTNSPHERVDESVAEHTIALIFALTHRIVEADEFVRKGKYHEWNPNLLIGMDLIGKTLGIIGAGKIGTSVMKRLSDGFHMNILYHNRTRDLKIEKMTNATFCTLEKLLSQSDIVSLHVPLLPQTHHLINKERLALMKKTGFLINTARGPVIDEHALIQALKKNQIKGAALDVFEGEPFIALKKEDIKELRSMKNVVLTPHIASATKEAREAMSEVVAQNVIAFLNKKIPPNMVV